MSLSSLNGLRRKPIAPESITRTFIINYYSRSSKGPALALTADVPTVTQDDAGAATQFVPART